MMERIRGVIRASATVSARVHYADHVGGTPYEGEYTVTPALSAQSLPTAGKTMREDVQIREIPIESVSNTAGGQTVIIG